MFRAIVLLTCLCSLVGCSTGADSVDLTTEAGAFNWIKSGINDMEMDINNVHYHPGDELGSDSFANTLINWVEESKGTEIEAESQKLLDTYREVEAMAGRRASADELKPKVAELKTALEEIENKRG